MSSHVVINEEQLRTSYGHNIVENYRPDGGNPRSLLRCQAPYHGIVRFSGAAIRYGVMVLTLFELI